jgi:hypothetical protein
MNRAQTPEKQMTKLERWFKQLEDIGCIVCRNEMGVVSPPDIHHIQRNGRRVDDFHTIPLCPLHHRSGVNSKEYVSRHPWKKEFERRYGTEWELFNQTLELVEDLKLATSSFERNES